MAAEAMAGAMRDALVVLGAAAVVIPLFHRIRVSPVLGFMLVGMAVGPAGLGTLAEEMPALRWVTIADRGRIEPLADLGVVLLLFMIGLELSWERIKTMRRLVFGLGSLQLAGSTLAVAGTAMLLGVPPAAAGVVALALAMSSTAVVAQVLAEERRMTGLVGRVSFAVLLFQDLMLVPVLFGLGAAGGGAGWAGLGLAVLKAVGMVAVIVGGGRLALRPLFRGVARTGSPELFMAACLLVVLGTGVAADSAGLSMALGALIAGLLLAETEYRRQIEVTVEPFKGLLLGVFLISIGMSLDLASIARDPLPVLGAALGLVAVKAAVTAALARGFGLRLRVGGPAGLLLGPGGEFSFVILGLAQASGLVGPALGGFAFIVAALTMAAIPLLSRLGTLLAGQRPVQVAADLLPPETPGDGPPPVILAGFGRVGQTVAALLDAHALPWVAVDSDADRVAAQRRGGRAVYYGDITRPELLHLIGLADARALVVTIDDRARADALVQTARAERPDLLIVARARDGRHAARLYALGASDAVPETIEASLQLSEAVLVDLGVPMGPVLVSIHERRAALQGEIKAMAPGATVVPRGQVRLRRR
ncbi:MAG: cation:proton antiporter [Janthinobacterium lividum]